MKCPSCGFALADDIKICPRCSNVFTNQTSGRIEKTSTTKYKIQIIIGIVLLVGDLAGAFYFKTLSLAGDNWSVDFLWGIILGIIFLVSGLKGLDKHEAQSISDKNNKKDSANKEDKNG